MVLRKKTNRARGHKYITGLGDGDVKPHIGVGNDNNNNNNVNYINNGGRHRGYDNVNYQNTRDESNDDISYRSFLRRGFLSKQKESSRGDGDVSGPNRTGDSLARIYADVSYQDWKKAYAIDSRQQQNGQEYKLASGTGSNDIIQGSSFRSSTLHHYYRNPVPQAADLWHFSAFFVCFATVILVIAVFLNMLSDHYSSTTNSTILSTTESKKSGPVGNDNQVINGTSNSTKKFKNSGVSGTAIVTNTRKIRRIQRNPKKDDDYDDASAYYNTEILLTIPDGSNNVNNNNNKLSIENLLPSLEDSSIAAMNPFYYQQTSASHQHQPQLHRQRKNSSNTPASGSGTTSTSGILSIPLDASIPIATKVPAGNTSGNYSPSARRRGHTITNQTIVSRENSKHGNRHIPINSNQYTETGCQPYGYVRGQYLDLATYPSSASSDQYRQQQHTRVQQRRHNSNHEIPNTPFPQTLTLSPSPLPAGSPSYHDVATKFVIRNHNRMLYARPLSTTASSFGSLVDHPEVNNHASPDSFLDRSQQDYDIDGYKDPMYDTISHRVRSGDEESYSSHTFYHDGNETTATPSQVSRSGSQNVRYRRVKDTSSHELGSQSLNRLISPGSDDIKYLFGLKENGTGHNPNATHDDNIAIAGGKTAASSSNSKGGALFSGQNSYTSTIEQGTPKHGRMLQMYRPTTADLLESTPRVTNGRQVLVDGDLGRSNSSRRSSDLRTSSFEVIAEQPALPSFQKFKREQEQQPIEGAEFYHGEDDNSNSTSFSDFNTGFSDADVCMKFASPPKIPKMHNSDNLIDLSTTTPAGSGEVMDLSDLPFVPNLYSVITGISRPPVSVNVDDLYLYRSYQLMETGNVPHWEARVAEESRMLKEQHDVNDGEQSDVYVDTTIGDRDDEAFITMHSSQRLNVDNIRDQVMAVATDLQSSNGTIPSDDPRKGIAHIRDDLTLDTDSASSLQGMIEFSELKLVDVIGGGGFGQVWRAVWRGTPVAVKVLTGSAQSKAVPKAVLQEFAAEINLLKGMRHPNICLYMGACITPPNRAIITELAANGSLWDALRLPLAPPYIPCDGLTRSGWPTEMYQPDSRHGAPPILSSTGIRAAQLSASAVPPKGTWHWVLVKHVARGAARGMAYLHSGKPPVLHRDLKSANILLDESYTAKVCDFGLSRLKAHESSMTGNCGTVQWMAPEVLSNERYNEKADVFSYGIICWELLSAECPYDGMTPIQCALAVLNRDMRPEIPKWCPPSLQALIRTCWKKDPSQRPTFEQVIAALDSMP